MLRQAQHGRIWLAWLALLAAVLLAAPLAAQPKFPALNGRLVDGANLLDPAQEQAIEARLAALETQSQRQLVVATVPSLQGYDISDYGYQLGRAWGLGDKERNDGALLIVAPNERKVRVEVGYGLEGVLTDALSSMIIHEAILPRFRQGDYAGGIAAAVDRLVAHLQLPDDEARRVAEQAQAQAQQQRTAAIQPEFGWSSVVFLLFIGLFFVLPMLRAMRGGGRRRRYRSGSGLGPIILWSALNSMSQGGRGGFGGNGGFGGGFGGGGGFTGGGGSFGGGGASGSW